MIVKNLTVETLQIIVGVNNMLNNKYVYGQGPHRKNIKGLQ